MKKVTILLLIPLLFVAFCIPSSAYALSAKSSLLSSLSEDECIDFIISQGLQIPDELLDYPALGAFIKEIIVTIENDPDHIFVINYPVTFTFANQIKAVVNEHYGRTSVHSSNISRTSAYSLQYSTTVGAWLDEYLGYNCYGYAVGRTRPYDGFYTPYYPGCFNPSTTGNFSINMSVIDMALLTISDLKYMGYDCVASNTSYAGITSLATTHNVICLRKCSTVGKEDYHYMKLSNSEWLHKPGNTHVLKLNHLPFKRDWYNEGSYMGVTTAGDRYYTGTICYIAYAENHSYSAPTYSGNNYHSGVFHYYEYVSTCTGCGETHQTWEALPCSGPPVFHPACK